MGPLAALLAPLLLTAAAPIDPRIVAAFERAPRQRVIVEIADEGEADRPLAFLPAKADRERRLAAREAFLGARKDRVLERARQILPAARQPRLASRWPSFPLMAVEADAEGLRV